MPQRTTRRHFLQTSLVAGAGLSLSAASWVRAAGANSRLRVASIGPGGKGWSDLTGVAASPLVEVVAICDIDEGPQNLGRAAEKYPAAQRYTDFRRVLDDAPNFDAVIVSTPDHMHAPISLAAMQLGKHVHCQKPLTHTVFEARQMQLAAKRAGVVTQMGNQIQSHSAYRTAVKLVHDGAIGKVQEVHSWQSGKMGWLLEADRPAGADPVPPGVHWNEWLGVVPERPYKTKIYHPFNWRAWQDFSNGQLGDFGCHIMDPVFMALELTAPRPFVPKHRRSITKCGRSRQRSITSSPARSEPRPALSSLPGMKGKELSRPSINSDSRLILNYRHLGQCLKGKRDRC